MPIGIWEVLIILAIVLILFGAGKLPSVMGDVAKGIKSFKKGLNEDEVDEKSSSPEKKTSKKTSKSKKS